MNHWFDRNYSFRKYWQSKLNSTICLHAILIGSHAPNSFAVPLPQQSIFSVSKSFYVRIICRQSAEREREREEADIFIHYALLSFRPSDASVRMSINRWHTFPALEMTWKYLTSRRQWLFGVSRRHSNESLRSAADEDEHAKRKIMETNTFRQSENRRSCPNMYSQTYFDNLPTRCVCSLSFELLVLFRIDRSNVDFLFATNRCVNR